MRGSFHFAVVLVVVLGLVGAAQGAVLTSASISIPMGTAMLMPPITGTGVGISVGLGATATLGSNVVVGTVYDPLYGAPSPIEGAFLTLTWHAAGSFVAGGGPGGGLGGPMTLDAQIRMTGYSGMVTLVRIPLSVVGQPGGFVSQTGGGGTIIQVYGTGWTTGVQTLMAPGTTIAGSTQTPGTYTAAGLDARTAGGAGTLVLITPISIRTNLAGDIPTFATLTLNYVPEPSTLLLVGMGIAGLALRGRRRH